MEYLETPQYLRKAMFPRSEALKFAGLMNPVDAPHHLRATEWFAYREGVVINRFGGKAFVNIGIDKDCVIDSPDLEVGTRVTIKLD